jgi:hypothetical protein
MKSEENGKCKIDFGGLWDKDQIRGINCIENYFFNNRLFGKK